MKSLIATIEDVFREAAARWTLIAYFVLTTAFILLFASAVNLDVVDGALAGAKLFGQTLQLDGEVIPIEQIVQVFQTGFSVIIFFVSVFLAIFATAHLVPRLQDKGTVDLYLSRPVSRTRILLERYAAGMLLASLNIGYLILTIWLIVGIKTGVFEIRFLLVGWIILLLVAVFLAFAFLIGVLTSSTAVSIMSSFALFFIALTLSSHTRIEDALNSEWARQLVHASYWMLPKVWELLMGTMKFLHPEEMPPELVESLSVYSYMTTVAFGIAAMVLAVILFNRKEY